MIKPLSKRELGIVLQQLLEMQQEAMSDTPPTCGICTSLYDRTLKLGETDARWSKGGGDSLRCMPLVTIYL